MKTCRLSGKGKICEHHNFGVKFVCSVDGGTLEVVNLCGVSKLEVR